ncbi:hypothetical protein BCR39DRAFT_529982 [Naematelia encephala]|uniref:ATP-grasp domain-containing protein n=1 Tax=Naematelia encephala TaxID=71784 RepID=A0A1Y2B5U3_9TREE|nr:hypothetical protein BCR39DRAFT_529982 [Naematelia encephala]
MTKRVMSTLKIALLHQAAPQPAIGGVRKPMKPGGYADGCADIAHALQSIGETVITPHPNSSPSPIVDLDWSFPDTQSGILQALSLGTNLIWPNTSMHTRHPLVDLLPELEAKGVQIVGQNVGVVEEWDDKAWLNAWLSSQKGLEGWFPKAKLIKKGDATNWGGWGWPAIAKPVRGRGSHGVKRVSSEVEMEEAIEVLLKESDEVLVEEYLAGEEITVTVMPPGKYSVVGDKAKHWALPVVTRFDQINGVAPWNGTVPVSANSRVVTQTEHDTDPAYRTIQEKCELVASIGEATAPIRIDCRRLNESGGDFVLFDVNVKPNAGGPGRPGRDSQAALTTMAAEAIGWSWPEFAREIVRGARPPREILVPRVIRKLSQIS